MSHPRLLLLLLLLGTGRALSLSGATSIFSCLHAALAEGAKLRPQEENAVLDKRGSEPPSMEEASEEDRDDEEEEEEELEKRTFPREPVESRARSHRSGAKGERRAKVTLSLDVPTTIMNILFNIAKAKNLRAKAAANAHLMAQIGRRK
ncbi:urocortin-3 [Malurus melanocephalus]|uniref:urocortin-3 n=1 Tax=Malurus melanocephalus TaxID=175006 RepID=UPI002548B7C1|nr:urocortin-3 [Malurus melanocephalus]